MTITAAADGSALGNPGPAGWAWYVDETCWRAGGWPHGTNNQGELMAVLDLFRSTAHLPEEPLRILCDSQYVINCITKWMPGWKRKGWRKADGKAVLNVELLKDIDAAIVGRKYSFEWVKGHAGHDLNEAADVRARAVATAYQNKTTVPSGPGFSGATTADPANVDTATTGPTADEPTSTAAEEVPAADQKVTARSNDLLQDDLFSSLEDNPFAPESAKPQDIVVAQERELLDPAVRADIGRTGLLLHKDFEEIGASGRLWSRDAMITSLEAEAPGQMSFELLSAELLNPTTVLVTYRTQSRDQGRAVAALRSSIWLQVAGQWRLRFHQGTVEA
ncbi:RNase H family protein [Pseudarthrobacter sp. J1763]|uniref:RNase H family protein n=1 Tax=Pseudarthrobacter sp. J1763 TaxID=3420445 RepID=UPI003D276F3F